MIDCTAITFVFLAAPQQWLTAATEDGDVRRWRIRILLNQFLVPPDLLEGGVGDPAEQRR
jgi:hypothetical protein